MPSSRRISSVLILVATALLQAGCASLETGGDLDRVNRELVAFTGGELREQTASRAALLAEPLSQESAVRVALLGSPALQSLLASKRAEIAEAQRAGRIGNPILTYERVREHGKTEIGRMLSIGLLELLTLPQRQRVAAAEREAAELRLAIAVVDEVTRVRQAWVMAVAAEQQRRYAERVLDSATASAELARRMEAAGNFNRLSRARQQAFESDARTQLVLRRHQATAQREALVRALALDESEAAQLRLPERLPDVPKSALAAEAVAARANSERLDVRLADANFKAAARRSGLGEFTTRTDIELGVIREGERRGYEVEIRLPVFDWGDLDRSALDARTRAAASGLEATVRAAGSHLRESYSGYLAAHASARTHLDELVPLRRSIAEENLLRYNGMLIGVFELLADAREQVGSVMTAIEAEQQFWLADAALQAALVGRPAAANVSAPSGGTGGAGSGGASADH